MHTDNKLKNKLKEKGLKLTNQRLAILQILVEENRPLRAKDIFENLSDNFPKLRLSTVYRNLNNFARNNIVRKMQLDLDNKETYFELLEENHHHHLVCVDCNQIKALACPLQEYMENLGEETGYTIMKHNIKVFGLCNECKNKNERKGDYE